MLRRTTSIATARTVAAIETLLTNRLSFPTTSSSALPANSDLGGEAKPSYGFQVRDFHAKSGPLNFRASSTLFRAQVALAEDYDESPKVSGKVDLEIANLGIDKEIVSALAKKGITKLFPIQVILSFPI